jgi:predicted deacylase
MVEKELKVGNVTAKPGELKLGYIRGVELDLFDVDIPVILANGKHEGPILSITAAVHGTEISGVEVIRKVLREKVKVSELHGAIIAIPVCNPLGFAWHSHSSPQDRVNMSTIFPGDPNGSLTRRLAYKICAEVLHKSQYNIDIHHDGWPALPYVMCKSEIAKDEETGKKALEMAKAVGLTILHQGKDPFWGVWGSLTDHTIMSGIPSITIEINSPMGVIANEGVDIGVRSVLNVMKYLKMIGGEIEPHPKSVRVIPGEFLMKPGKFPRARHGGVLIMEKTPGEFIRKGEIIATIYDVFGEKLEEVEMTIDGYIWAYKLESLVAEGEIVALVFTEFTPESLEEKAGRYEALIV